MGTSTVDKAAALAAVKTLSFNHLATKALVMGDTIALESTLPERENKTQCRQCEKVFVCISYLSRYDVVHSGEKLHQCPQCRQSFSWLGSLTRHIKNNIYVVLTQKKLFLLKIQTTQTNLPLKSLD